MENEFEENEAQQLNLTVDVQVKSACERHVKIEVAREDADRYFDREYEEPQKPPRFPASAPVKPRKLIERRRNDAQERVKAALIQDSLVQADKDQNMTPISEPDFDFKAVMVPASRSFIYEYDAEVRPSFDVPNWKGLKLEKPVRDFTPEDADARD